jgi:hypothetical protein
MHSPSNGIQLRLNAFTLALLLVVLWLLMRGYLGFAGDAQIYAFQALARIFPALSTDLYLQNTSQDQYTIFSPFYAAFISWLGLENAARLLTLLFTIWMLAAAWHLAAAVTDRAGAWLAVAFCIIAAGDYGASGVFRIFEQYLTPRLPAEAMVITAFACYSYGMKGWSSVIAIAALFVHPLMALPGVLLLVFWRLPNRMGLIGAIAGVCAALGIALCATTIPAAAHVFAVMDADWLEVVEERSQFLFLQLWSPRDWDINVRPLIYLIFFAVAMLDPRIRRFCVAGLAVGICGLAVALIACLIGPVAILVQGQAWRWVWVGCLISVLLLPAMLLRVWDDKKCGPMCAVLLICGWACSAVAGTACVLSALFLWLFRSHISGRAVAYLRWAALVAGLALLLWVDSGLVNRGPIPFAKIGDQIGVKVSAALLFGFLCWRLRGFRQSWVPLTISAVLLVFTFFIVPASFKQARTLGSDRDAKEFSDWLTAIPPASTVLVTPARDVGSFVWFALKRPNYLALDQSAGVVFSRETALEVRRRSDVLQPLMDPSWKILSSIRRSTNGHKDTAPARPLTAEILVQICSDPKLGFVVSPQNVGFNPIRHAHDGPWKDWNLYECGRVRSPLATT